LEPIRAEDPRIYLDVVINGKHVSALLDTGADVSTLELGIAEQVGVKRLTGAGAVVGSSAGIAGKEFPEWLGLADTVTIGDETIRNVRVRVGAMFAGNTMGRTGSHISRALSGGELLLGLDFLLAHRLLVLPKEHVAVFTYNGRPPFQYVAPDPQESPGATQVE
jgi:hypothetical protein